MIHSVQRIKILQTRDVDASLVDDLTGDYSYDIVVGSGASSISIIKTDVSFRRGTGTVTWILKQQNHQSATMKDI